MQSVTLPDLSTWTQTLTDTVDTLKPASLLSTPALTNGPLGALQPLPLMLDTLTLMTRLIEALIGALDSSVTSSNAQAESPDSDTNRTPTQTPSASISDSGASARGDWRIDADTRTIDLDNGYRLAFANEHQSWTLTDASGDTVRIWGDPHVDEDNDGVSDWDFKQDATFVLDDGTKISVGTVDIGHANHMTVTDTLMITRGDQAIEVTGIADNDVHIRERSGEGAALDAATNDGYGFFEGDDGVASWYDDNGQRITENQAMGAERHNEYDRL